MRYLALVTDYDGVIATDGKASSAAISAIERLRRSGRRIVMVTGRRLEDLREVFPHLSLFDFVVAENGAVLYDPRTLEETLLAEPPPPEFVRRLQELGVEPLEVGRVIVGTWLPHHTTVLRVIQELGLELQIIFNRTAVMVLPGGVNKASGMGHALRKLGLSRHEVVGIGDSENDHSFLKRSECAAAVDNAVPSLRKIADLVTKRENGLGFAELIDELIGNDLSRLHGAMKKNLVTIGLHSDGSPVSVAPFGPNILIAGPSGSGKSTVASGIIERLIQQTYQLCIVDPEGDYGALSDFFTLGNQRHPVTVNEVLAIIEDPNVNLAVNLLGIPLADRPEFFGELFPNLQAMRTRTGRPHWIVLDEAHHMLPAEWSHLGRTLPQNLGETVFITVHPEHLAPTVLSLVDVVIAVGPSPEKTMKEFADATGQAIAWPEGLQHQKHWAVAWFPRTSDTPFAMKIISGRAERIRHHRKYAEGNMKHRSFYFRGPEDRHNIQAQNLTVFSQIAAGIDERDWIYHLRQGDYSRWFRASVKDNYLADQAERIEQRQDLAPVESRKLILSLIEARYTLPK